MSTANATAHLRTTTTTRLLAGFVRIYRRLGMLGYGAIVAAFIVALSSISYPRVSNDFSSLTALLIGIALLGCILALLPSLLLPVYQRRTVEMAIASGEVWVRWHYSDEDRQQIAQLGLRDSVLVIPVLNLIALPLGLGWLAYQMAQDGAALAGVLLAGGITGIVLLVAVPPYLRQQRRKALYAAGVSEVIITPIGMSADGLITPFFPPLGRLTREVARQASTPNLLVFTTTYVSFELLLGYYLSEVGRTLNLPVPQGREAEAAAIVERLRAVL